VAAQPVPVADGARHKGVDQSGVGGVLPAQLVGASGSGVRTALECGGVDVYQVMVDAVQHISHYSFFLF
jgi:hypothetical protein